MIPPIRRAVWLTGEQRKTLLNACEQCCDGESPAVLRAAYEQVRDATQRERVTGRLVRGHVTGLRLPHDAIPIRLTDEEAHALHDLEGLDDHIRRLLNPYR